MKKSKKSKKNIDSEIGNDSSLEEEIAMEFIKFLSDSIEILGIDKINEIVSKINEKK